MKIYYSKIQNLSFFETEFVIFQLQAAGNPGLFSHAPCALVPSVRVGGSHSFKMEEIAQSVRFDANVYTFYT